MTGLVLKLSPKERILINGAVIENGDRRSRITICTADANILRLKDAIHPKDATTPVKMACYSAQLLLCEGTDTKNSPLDVLCQIEQLSQVLCDTDSRKHLACASEALIDQKYYQCLKFLRLLIPRENRLLAVAS